MASPTPAVVAVGDPVPAPGRVDAATGLASRASLLDRLADPRESLGVRALVLIDVDHFARINESLGYCAADRVLAEVADRLREVLRREDLVARVDGDAFAVLLEGTRVETAKVVARRLRARVSEPIDIDHHHLQLSASIGIAVRSDGDYHDDPCRLLGDAELALHEAKCAERGGVRVFDPGMREKVRTRLSLEGELRAAIRDGALDFHAQPLWRSDATTIAGFEILARWRPPGRPPVSPGVFVPLAEELGIAGGIADLALARACRAAARWWMRAPERELFVAVNLSARDMADPDLVDRVLAAVSAAGLPPRLLELEVTETAIIENAAASRRVMRALRSRGIRFALDDFGTGYSALSYLQQFPFDTLKVDRSFVARIHRDPRQAKLVRAIVGLARSLDMDVVAEGVEETAQVGILRAAGCDLLQGFLFARPGPLEQVEEGLRPAPALRAAA